MLHEKMSNKFLTSGSDISFLNKETTQSQIFDQLVLGIPITSLPPGGGLSTIVDVDFTTSQTDDLSVTVANTPTVNQSGVGEANVNIANIGGTNIDSGAGITTLGTMRVVHASDSAVNVVSTAIPLEVNNVQIKGVETSVDAGNADLATQRITLASDDLIMNKIKRANITGIDLDDNVLETHSFQANSQISAMGITQVGMEDDLDVITPLLTDSAIVKIASTSGLDISPGGIGAHNVLVTGRSFIGSLTQEVVALTGQVAVTLTKTFFRIEQLTVISWGSTLQNQGTIYLSADPFPGSWIGGKPSLTIVAIMRPNRNLSQTMLSVRTPRFIPQRISTFYEKDSNATGIIEFQVRNIGDNDPQLGWYSNIEFAFNGGEATASSFQQDISGLGILAAAPGREWFDVRVIVNKTNAPGIFNTTVTASTFSDPVSL